MFPEEVLTFSEEPRQGLRVGVDMVRSAELQRLLKRPWFLRLVYADEELSLAGTYAESRRVEFLTGRFAAKEAVLKVLECGLLGSVRLRDIVVEAEETGRPRVRLRHSARRRAGELHVGSMTLSIAHKNGVVIAAVLASPPAGSGVVCPDCLRATANHISAQLTSDHHEGPLSPRHEQEASNV